ncbi:MAG: LacI family transcriptional regulator [Acidobacteria bacterium]|nr:MAG: LacI family transcriptional regulator [Acidobacteriota bacterium]
MATVQDVAKKAGVAPITVSRVVNNSGYVSKETRERVEAAVTELGYVPNTLARSLRSKRTHTLALVLSDITNPFFTLLARGVEDAASDAGFTVVFCNTDESEKEERRYLELLLQKKVDGILLVPARLAADSVSFIQSQGTPVVVLDRRLSEPLTDVVRCDSETGAYQLMRLLLQLGHRRIAILSGPPHVSTAIDRVAGCQRAMADFGAADLAVDVYYGSFTHASGGQMARRAVATEPRPSALFAANNFIAIGALRALHDLGVKVPEEMALVGFDDLPPSLITFPFLTVAAQPAYEMGEKGTRLLLERLSGKNGDPPREVVLPVELIVRQSSGNGPGKAG